MTVIRQFVLREPAGSALRGICGAARLADLWVGSLKTLSCVPVCLHPWLFISSQPAGSSGPLVDSDVGELAGAFVNVFLGHG